LSNGAKPKGLFGKKRKVFEIRKNTKTLLLEERNKGIKQRRRGRTRTISEKKKNNGRREIALGLKGSSNFIVGVERNGLAELG